MLKIKMSCPSLSDEKAVAVSKKQIKLFHNMEEMQVYVDSFSPKLKRVLLVDIPNLNSFEEHSYVGGQVLNVLSDSYSQGHAAMVFVEDVGVPDSIYNLIIKIDGDLVEMMPSVDSEYMLFVSGAIYLEDEEIEYSQDTGKRVIVEGTDVEVFVIHPKIDDPKRYVKVCGPKWWKKRKKRMEYRKQLRQKQELSGAHRGASSSEEKAVASGVESEGPGPSGVGGKEPGCSAALVETGPQLEQFPDNDDFPESAFGSSSEHESSESASSSSSSCDDLEVTWSPKKASPTRYEYSKLADLQPGLKKVNIIAVVKEFEKPRNTRGNDFFSSMTLVDESNPHVGVRCSVFQSSKERLPCLKREGDIVCLHRVNTNEHRNEMRIEGPKFSSSLRFSSNVGRKIKPCTGSVSYTFTSVERQRVRELRKWLLKEKRSRNAKKMESIANNQMFDLLCQVVCISYSLPIHQTTLSVWDGTICPLTFKSQTLENADVSSSLMASVGPELQQQITFQGKLSSQVKIKPGSYVFITNIEASSQDGSGIAELRVTRDISKCIDIISVREYGHSELKDQLECALAAQSVVTSTPHDDLVLSTLEKVQNSQALDGPCKFYCKAKLVCVLTPCVEDMVRLHCEQCGLFETVTKSSSIDTSGISTVPCPDCHEAGQWLPESCPPTCMYLVQLLLRDNTASLVVHVPHAEAIKLFHRLQPTNFYRYQTKRYELMKMLYKLSGGNPPFSQQCSQRARPWIACCLLKVVEGKKAYYCVFDTCLK